MRKTSPPTGLFNITDAIAEIARLLVSCLLLLALTPAWADAKLRGRVVSVAGGDTLTLIDAQHREHKLRLAYIDAPELGQTFGDEAQSALAAMVLNKEVDALPQGKAADGTMRVEVIDPSGNNVGLTLLRHGLAWHDYFERQPAAEREQYRAASQEAQRDRRGMWALDRLEAPRDYRARREQLLRWWLYVAAGLAALLLVSGAFAIYGDRLEAWLAKQDELEKSRAEGYRLARIASEAEADERQRTREIANREMDRLATERHALEASMGRTRMSHSDPSD